jgi:hypothetical protein
VASVVQDAWAALQATQGSLEVVARGPAGLRISGKSAEIALV